MVIKYYGSSRTDNYVGWTATHAIISSLWATDPYKNVTPHPSYCVWIVPGTVDSNGDDIVFGPIKGE